MIDVYFYLQKDEADLAVECGLKLSKWYEKEVLVGGEMKRCISCLMNPKDDIIRFKSPEFRCVKIQVPPNYSFIADKQLYNVGLKHSAILELYYKSVIPLDNYIFGTYRFPECLLITTVIPGQLEFLGKRLESPILFESSEELYINNIIEIHRDRHEHFNDAMLYGFYMQGVQKGIYKCFEDEETGFSVFVKNSGGQSAIVRIPNMGEYAE